MTELYTVRFTTRKLIKTLDKRGKVVSECQLDAPICITALPHQTAMSYKGCDNFAIEKFQMEDRFARGTHARKEIFQKKSAQFHDEDSPVRAKKAAAPIRSKSEITAAAAASGDMTGALNG